MIPVEGLFAEQYSVEWKKNKKFALMALRSYGFGSAVGEAKILDQFNKMATAIDKYGSTAFNPNLMCQKAAACVIFGIVLNKNFTFEDPELKTVIELIENWVANLFESNYQLLDLLPQWLSSIIIPDYKKRMIHSTKALRTFLLDYINPHIREFDQAHPRDVVGEYLKEHGADQIDPITIANKVITFAADGVATVSAVLNAILFYVTKYQDVQSRIQEQLDAVVGSTRKVSTNDKSSLPLVDAAINETLRIMTPVIVSPPRETIRDTTISGYNIPKGSLVLANIFGIHTNPATYKQAQLFRLEHFLQEDGRVIQSPEALAPFGLGKRCYTYRYYLTFIIPYVMNYHGIC